MNALDTPPLSAEALLSAAPGALEPRRGVVRAWNGDGLIEVDVDGGITCHCECLQDQAAAEPGARVLLLVPAGGMGLGIVLGRIGPQRSAPRTLEVRATESLSLKCGEASIDLRADGKVMIRGEDVLVRAKGTKRIRAGTVAIN